MLIIGESLNGTIEKVGRSILERNEKFLRDLARLQCECGAQCLDVNAGVAGGNEIDDLPWMVEVVQSEVSLPLMIDSANPEALRAALAVYRHSEPAILNSISGEEEKWNKLFPVAVESGCRLVVLCMDDQGIPQSVEERLAVASRLFQRLAGGGVPPERIYFDPLVLSVAVAPEAGLLALDAIRRLRSDLPGTHVLCGLSNVSMGLPGRRLINRTFLAMAVAAGLDALLVDVRDQALRSTIQAGKALMNEDSYCLEYIEAFRGGKLSI